MSQGLIAPDAQLSENEAAQLIFMQGFSTATEVTDCPAGVGMDVVRSEVNAFKRTHRDHHTSGQGSSFRRGR